MFGVNLVYISLFVRTILFQNYFKTSSKMFINIRYTNIMNNTNNQIKYPRRDIAKL